MLVASKEFTRYGDMEEQVTNAFFSCPVVWPLSELLEGLMFRWLHRKFFVLKAISVCSNIVLSMNRKKYFVFLCFLDIMRVVIWTMQQKGFHEGESFSFQTLLGFYKLQIKIKMNFVRRRLISLEFGERWVKG